MVRVNILTPFDHQTFERQFDADWLAQSSISVEENGQADESWDVVVVYDDLRVPVRVRCRKGGLVLVTGEPPDSKPYAASYVAQFDHVVTCHRRIFGKKVTHAQQALPWHYGYERDRKTYSCSIADLKKTQPPNKTHDLSVIASTKTMMPGHQTRVDLVRKILDTCGEKIDRFGAGARAINDKALGLLPYRFHLAIENSRVEDYWTEKLADAYLGYCVPIYWGCPNIYKYFDRESLLVVHDEKSMLEVVDEVLRRPEDIYNEKFEHVLRARKRVLEEYNLPVAVDGLIQKSLVLGVVEDREVWPSSSYVSQRMLMMKLRARRFLTKKLWSAARYF